MIESSSSHNDVAKAPVFSVDLHSEEVLRSDPHPVYAEMRSAGPVLWMEKYGMFAFPRFQEVAAALKDWDTFTSVEGAGLNDTFNSFKSSSVHSTGALHSEIREIESRPIAPDRLAKLKPELREYALHIVRQLGDRTRVDGVADIAAKLPLDVVAELVGLDNAGHRNLYAWGIAGFNMIGPSHASRTSEGFETWGEYVEYARANIPHNVRQDGWAAQLFKNGRAAGWSDEFCHGVMMDYVGPSLDTTIHAISAGLKLFAENPEQWDKVRADRALMLKGAVPEIVRLASPIQYFTRVTTRDVEIGGVTLPVGSRVLMMYASANRDERKFPDPERFDVERGSIDQIGWGVGRHACMGKALARLEIVTVFNVLADHYSRLVVNGHAYGVNNLVRGLESLDLGLVRDSAGQAASVGG